MRFAGRIGCATFPYACSATLSVLKPNARVPDDWRPAVGDATWAPTYGVDGTAETFDPKPVATAPTALPGPHRLVMSLLGSYDAVSPGPDGKPAFDLLGRCLADVDIPTVGPLAVLVTFTPDESSFDASCTIAVLPTNSDSPK